MEENQNNYRFEKKFIVEKTRLHSVLFDLKSSGFFKIFPNRVVNSVYFDDKDFSAYYENLEGLSNRTKYRFRFYGESSQCQFNNECQAVWGDCSVGLGGCHYSINPLYFNPELVNNFVDLWLSNDCMECVCDCASLPNSVCNNP